MQVEEGPGHLSKRLLRPLVGTSVAALLALIILLLLHAGPMAGDGVLLVPMEGVAALFALSSAGALVVGVSGAWKAYPQHHGAIVAIAVITIATFTAHAYVMGSPPAYVPKTASGAVGTTFTDGTVNVTSSLTGGYLTVTVTAQAQYNSGSVDCCVIADPALLNSSGALSGQGFVEPPTLASPLAPGNSAHGTWVVDRPVSSLNVTYDSLVCYSEVHQEYGCIMDEIYYVPEAMGILAGQQCATSGSVPPSCHMEHPPLAPALMAAGMAILGEYNSAGWRLFPALLGTLSVPVLFGIAWKLSGNKKLSLVAASLLALDVMFFSQSGAGVLDVPQVFFGLAAFLAYLVGVKWWKFDKYIVSGVLMGLAGLAKETGVFLVLALVTWILLFERGSWRGKAFGALKVVLVVGLVFTAGVQAYDSTLARSVPTFVDQIRYVLSYGAGLNAGCPWACGWTNSALGGYITPFDWVFYYSPVGYYVTNITTCTSGACASYVGVGYYGVTNLIETWTVFVWIPLVALELFRYRRSRQVPPEAAVGAVPAEMSGDVRVGAFALLLFIWTYVPYIPLFLAGRVTYPFYFVPAIPAVAVGASWWGTRSYFPKWLLAVYLATAFAFFLVYFPDKSFLPAAVRAFLRH